MSIGESDKRHFIRVVMVLNLYPYIIGLQAGVINVTTGCIGSETAGDSAAPHQHAQNGAYAGD
jgi:hypothetical protein